MGCLVLLFRIFFLLMVVGVIISFIFMILGAVKIFFCCVCPAVFSGWVIFILILLVVCLVLGLAR